jgi:hypothetical protein
MIATLQGVVARRSGQQIFIDAGGGYSLWRDQLRDVYGLPCTTNSNPWLLLLQFASFANGNYIRYNVTNANSLSVATSLCGPLNAVAIDASIELQAKLFGLTNMLLDVSARDEAWAWTNYNALFSRGNVVEQQEYLAYHLRDYATLANAFTFFDGNSAFRTFIMKSMDPDAACLGWGDASFGEDRFITNSSLAGVFTIASDYALDLSTLSSVRDPTVQQHTYRPAPPLANVHYVTFVVTDGDNVQWNINGYPAYFNHPAHGAFDMGWALAPSLADLGPSVPRWFYDHSSNGPNHDFFVAGVSGSGYFYPSKYPAADMSLNVQKLNDFMARTDLNIVQLLDFNSFTRLDVWDKYLAQPCVDSLFYMEYAPYNGAHGAVEFSANGKPIVAAREMLWAGLEEETNVIANINSAPRDPSSPSGYTMVAVHVWDKSLGNVQQVVTNLASDVRVVTPDVFARLIRTNVGCRLNFDFTNGLEGWVPFVGTKPFDLADWNSSEGGGCLELDGSDGGTLDSSRNSFFNRIVLLPPNALNLTFDTRALNDGRLRVRLKNHAGSFFTLLDWDTPTTTNWVTRTINLSGYAGQAVTLYFEQNDGGQGFKERRFVDNVNIMTIGSPLYLPTSPRLFSLSANLTNGVSLNWRAIDAGANQFRIERASVTNASWREVASISGTITNFTDADPSWGTNNFYRIRGWNTSGYGEYSNEQIITAPPKPALNIERIGSFAHLSWPLWATNYSLFYTTNLPGTWAAVTNSISTQSNSFNASVPIESSLHFFRLIGH